MSEYQEHCYKFATRGFIAPPVSEPEFNQIKAAGLIEQAHEIGCDLYCGAFLDIDEAIAYYKQNYMED